MPVTVSGDCQRGHVLPTKSEIRKLDIRQMAQLYHSYVENIQVACGDMRRMGYQQDGGWEICNDPLVKPKKSCLVYSFGINNDFSFDDEMAKEYKCEIHSFDPSMGQPDHHHGDHVTFHSLGVADYNGKSPKNWPVKTLADIRQSLHHQQTTIDVLKVDIEEMEWQVFPEIIRNNALHNVTQFVFEVHITLKKDDPPQAKYFTALNIFRDLYDLGYRIFYTHRNKWCHYESKLAGKQRTSCHEIFMMKVC
ncbi:probable methyltransferase-like protein 24 [Haliotis rubra]|uniref:probable methyltransferase-like protein 24 n=1 Tax=Haliotis rubra TaxID=36100 RepID=UPI001EE536EF|nr:probable methyltransferase-like protein 24 [Haliotis rubra]